MQKTAFLAKKLLPIINHRSDIDFIGVEGHKIELRSQFIAIIYIIIIILRRPKSGLRKIKKLYNMIFLIG